MLVQHPAAAVVHFGGNLIPGQEAQIPLFQQQPIAFVVDLFDQLADLDFRIDQLVDLPVQFFLGLHQADDGIFQRGYVSRAGNDLVVIGLGDLLCKAAQRIDLLQLAVNPLVKPIGLTKKFLCCHFRTSSCALTASISAVCVLSLR